jgi:HlyD family secretion protein
MGLHSSGALAPVPQSEPPSGKPALVESHPEKPHQRGRWVAVGVFLLVAGAAAWFTLRQTQAPAKPMAATRTTTVRRASIQRTLRLTGVTVAGRFSMLLAPMMTGSRHSSRGTADFQQILLNTAKPGSHVHKGDPIAEFDRLYMLMRLDDYKANVVQHEANLRSLNALLDVRRQSYAQQTIRYRGARDKAALDTKKAPVLSAIKAENNQLNLQQYDSQLKEIIAEEKFFEKSEKASIRRSELDLQVSRMEFKRAERNADAMVVKAPIDGLVVMQTIRRGSDTSEIQAGDQLYPGQPYMQVVDSKSICVDASVNQVDIEDLKVGASARVSFDAYPGLELPARVVSIGALANTKGWRANYVKDVMVRLALDKFDDRVIPNFSVAADVVLHTTPEVTVVPRESLFTEDGHTVAFVKGPQGWEKREVEIGEVNNTAAEVKAGLNLGEVVASEWPMTAVEAGASPR